MSDTSVVITNYISARRRKDALLTSSAIYFLPISISGTSGAQVPLGETGPLARAALRAARLELGFRTLVGQKACGARALAHSSSPGAGRTPQLRLP